MPTFSGTIYTGGRIVKEKKLMEVYYQEPVPITNITRVENTASALVNSGSVLVSSYPIGIDIFNRNIGEVTEFSTTITGATTRYFEVIETNLRRAGISISGARIAGKR